VSVTLAEAIATVRRLLDEQTAAFWSNTDLKAWINQGCLDVARQAEILLNKVTLSVVATQQDYTAPADFLNVHRAEFSPTTSDQTYSLTYREINNMDEIWGILHTLPAAYPQYFTYWERKTPGAVATYFILYPVPAQTGPLAIYYYRAAVPATGTTTAIDTQPGWEDIIYDYAVFKALRKDRDPTWQTAAQLYASNLQNMINRTRSRTDLGSQFTSGNNYWPVYRYGGSTDWAF
jgi:hypothetical protein